MKRAIVLGLGLLSGASAWAQTPVSVSVYPGTSVRTRPGQDATPGTVLAPADAPAPARFDALQPLGGLLAMPLPTSPTVAAGGCATGACAKPCGPSCGAALFPTAARDGSGKPRTCADRVLNWLTWNPGPGVLPVLTPTPYQAPLRAYFSCTPLKNPGYPATSCGGSPGVGTVSDAAGRVGSDGACPSASCGSPIPKGLGLFAKPSTGTPTTGAQSYGCAPVAIPLPAACVGASQSCGAARPACTSGCGLGAMDRLMNLFAPGCRGDAATATTIATYPTAQAVAPQANPVAQVAATAPATVVPVIMGYAPPAGPGYHFANPTSNRTTR